MARPHLLVDAMWLDVPPASAPSSTAAQSPAVECKVSARGKPRRRRQHHHEQRKLSLISTSMVPFATLTPRPPAAASTAAVSTTLQFDQRKQLVESVVASPLGHSQASTFRSVKVLEEVVRYEKELSSAAMTPDEALQMLRRILPPTPLYVPGLDNVSVLTAVEDACWRKFTGLDHVKASSSSGNTKLLLPFPLQNVTGGITAPPSPAQSSLRLHLLPALPSIVHADSDPVCAAVSPTKPLRVLYEELFGGLQGTVKDKKRALAKSKSELKETMARTNALPRHIKALEDTMAATITSFTSVSAAALDCFPRSKVTQEVVAMMVTDKISTLRRRRELRAWACNELRSVINDEMTRSIELKKEITHIVTEMKKEELQHKLKTKRMEEIMVAISPQKPPMAAAAAAAAVLKSHIDTERRASASAAIGDNKVTSTRVLLKPPTSTMTVQMGRDRLEKAQQRKLQLLETIAERKVHLRKRTEKVFDVRNQVRELKEKRQALLLDIQALDDEIVHIQRTCTPRPDWDELKDLPVLSAVVERAASKKARAGRQRSPIKTGVSAAARMFGSKQDDEIEEEALDRRVRNILSSKRSTIDKVHALAEEINGIRTRFQAGDAIAFEQAKLAHLQKEIGRTLLQLEAIKFKTQATSR